MQCAARLSAGHAIGLSIISASEVSTILIKFCISGWFAPLRRVIDRRPFPPEALFCRVKGGFLT
jgi:hypothetical protein